MKQRIRINENQIKQIVKESVKRVLKETENPTFSRIEMGRGEISVDASYNRIKDALDVMKNIADELSENGYYSTTESALRCNIKYIEREIDYIRNHTTQTM
jgi:hypothetical protein